jgi:hypothetical protein
MREIRIRSWYKELEQMRYYTLFDYKVIEQIYLHNNSIEMLSTGLKDKNGKEIYEGDILEFKEGYSIETNEVTFTNGCFYRGLTPLHQLTNLDGVIEELNVIGNIYEDSKLLIDTEILEDDDEYIIDEE